MTVYFSNKEPIDLNAIAIMGVSVKTETDAPIGFFGTGLKYAIATLLRLGCEVAIIRDGQRISFSAREEDIRGQKFQRVMMDSQPLGFTTDLGKKWECWQAYRELYSNTLDENGIITSMPPVGQFGTIIKVTGEIFDICHEKRGEIFLSKPSIFETASCAISNNPSSYGFYRGVRALQLKKASLFTYNIKEQLDLTEDRTIKLPYMFDHYAEVSIPLLKDKDTIRSIILAEECYLENGFNYANASKPSDEFMDVVYDLRGKVGVNRSAIQLWEKHAEVRYVYSQVTLDPYESLMLQQAFAILAKLHCPLKIDDLMFFQELGGARVAMVRAGKIYIGKIAFSRDAIYLAATLYEEYLHRDHKVRDFSRDMQDILFERLMSVTARLVAYEANLPPMAQAPMPSIPEVLEKCRSVGDELLKEPPSPPVSRDLDDELPF